MDYLSCLENPRIFFFCDSQHGIRLAVFKVDVVTGRVFFYEVVFKKKGLVFVAGCYVFDAAGIADEEPGLNVLVSAEV